MIFGEKKNTDLEFHIQETMKHKDNVKNFLLYASKIIEMRGQKHDNSKLQEPEQSIFIEYTPKLKNSTYGSDNYKQFLKEMKPALDHHYSNNRHHPEYFQNGIKDMNLIDLLEMIFDWWAATKRHSNGDIYKSIELNKERFGYDNLFAGILKNTIDFIKDSGFEIAERYFTDSDNEDIRKIVYDWMSGVCVDNDEYKVNYLEDDFTKAHEVIHTLISNGLG